LQSEKFNCKSLINHPFKIIKKYETFSMNIDDGITDDAGIERL
jgi:hypothetical protein